MDAKNSVNISLLIRFILLLQAQDVLCQGQTKPKICMNNKMYAINQARMNLTLNEAINYCLNTGIRIATIDADDTHAFERIMINCSLPFPTAQYWISGTTSSASCWKLSIYRSRNEVTSPMVKVQPSECKAVLAHVLCEVNATSSSARDTPKMTTDISVTGFPLEYNYGSVSNVWVSPLTMCQHFRRNATNTGYNSTAIKTTFVTSSPTCAFACQTHHACVLYTFNMASGCRMYNDSDFSLVFEDPNTELWTLQHRRYC